MLCAIAFRTVYAGLAVCAAAGALAQELSYAEWSAGARAALGGDLTTIEFSGDGWDACLGQAWRITEGWARWEIRDYHRVIDYGAHTSVQTAMRRAALDPERVGGCGAQPGAAAVEQRTGVTTNARWPDQLPIWLTPHGFLVLEANGTPAVTRERRGFKVAKTVLRDGTTYAVNGYYGRDLLPTRIETWIDDPIYGDLKVEVLFDDYRDFDGAKFPTSLVEKRGGFTTLALKIDGVVPRTDASAVPAPRNARAGGARAETQVPPVAEIADGVFVMSAFYQSVAVEFADFVVLIDGMQSDERVAEVIRLTHEAIPGKPIRYAVNTHSHNDHTSGLRLLAAEGATVLTHRTNESYLRDVLNRPRTLNPAAAPSPRVPVQGVGDEYVISDGEGQTVELHKLRGSLHADDMLIAYLPRSKTIVESDLLQPWINPVFGGGRDGPHPYLVHFYDELERLGLDYEQFVPIHVPSEPPTMSAAALREAVGR